MFLLLLLALLVGFSSPASPQHPAELYLDHVPVAVHSLDAAMQTYSERLGFVLKPGRAHPNGIRNAFTKFSDGSYLELITVGEATDDLSRWYRGFLDWQEGGAFLALRADSLPGLARFFQEHEYEVSLQSYGPAFSILSFSDSVLESVFMIEYLEPVQDDASLLEHPNTAVGLEAVWLPRGTFERMAELSGLWPAHDSVIALAGGMISMSSSPLRANVIGVTIRVRDLAATREALWNGTGEEFSILCDVRGRRLLVPPRATHGIWIEFLEPHAVP